MNSSHYFFTTTLSPKFFILSIPHKLIVSLSKSQKSCIVLLLHLKLICFFSPVILSCQCNLIIVLCAQLCLTLCDPMDCSLPGSSERGIFPARILEFNH